MNFDELVSKINDSLGQKLNSTEGEKPAKASVNTPADTQLFSSREASTGILFTDIPALADKFGVSGSVVLDSFQSFISECQKENICWHLLDAGDPVYDLQDSWEDYLRLLDDFYYGMGLDGTQNLSLFIIGGDDVIPMPRMINPLPAVGDEVLTVDMRYCFDAGDSDDDMAEGWNVLLRRPRMSVGRLPLPDSDSECVDFEKQVCDYLKRSLAASIGSGIDINGALMTTTQSWLPSSKSMMSDIPAASIHDGALTSYNGMLVSPDIDIEDDEMVAAYTDEISKADYLLFNLHGGDAPGRPEYWGQRMNYTYFDVLPAALSPSVVAIACPKIISATACYGARFIGYDKDDSMLLSAMDAGTLLFAGSCTTALGRGNGESASDILIPAGMSESLIKLYSLYLHTGVPAGEAFINAKSDYYRTCCSVDGCDEAMATIMMFNLYGNPMVRMVPKLDRQLERISRNSAQCIQPVFKHCNYSPVYMKNADMPEQSENPSADGGMDMLAVIRNKVDNNLRFVRERLEEELYSYYGLAKENLNNITEVTSDGGVHSDYWFTYKTSEHGLVIARTSRDGKVKDIIHTK